MPTSLRNIKYSDTITRKITSADYSLHPVGTTSFILNIPVNLPLEFNGFEVLFITNSINGVNIALFIPMFELPGNVFASLTPTLIGMPSLFFPTIQVPGALKMTMGLPAANSDAINGSVTANPDDVTIYPYQNLFGAIEIKYPMPLTHPVILKLVLVAPTMIFTMDMDCSITFFRA